MKYEAANPNPCSACPWRNENHGKPHPHGWYTKKNRKRLWAQLRRGESMSCHPTDPTNEVPEGTKPVPETVTPHECAGALILQQREVMAFQKSNDLKVYLKERPQGMTRRGLVIIAQRALFGGTMMMPGTKMTRPDLLAEVSVDGEKFVP